MHKLNDELKRALLPVKNRIRRNRFLWGAAAGLAVGLAAAVILQAAAFFLPVTDRGLWAAEVTAAVMLLTALVNAVRPVKDTAAAEAADACGLQERAITALEGGDEPICRLQRKDACEALEKLDVKMIRPGSIKKALFAALGCAALLAVLLLIPNAQDAEAASRKALNKTLQEGRKKIEQAVEEDEERLLEEKKSELRKITDDLKRELGESRDAADALVALDKAEQRLEQMREQTAGDAAAGESASGETGPGGNSGGAEGKASGKTVETADAGQAGVSSAAAAVGTDVQLQTMQTISALKSAVNPSQQATGSGMQGTAGNQGTQGGAGTGNNGSQSGQSGAGQGGSNTGDKAGGGAGEGTTNEEQKGSGNGSTGPVKGNRDPRYKEVQYETIYDPEHIDRSRQDVMTEQYRMGDEGSVQIETGPGTGNLDGDVPWGEALQEYADTEARAADRENLTTQERQWVNEYYRLLTEQQ